MHKIIPHYLITECKKKMDKCKVKREKLTVVVRDND